ncbi:MAG: hypothetical protein QHH13_02420 [Melioribacter sp.]|uniref:hypothetical protein n=1 Tax=Rosettibacter primus TaxID=3111523 RepID=UPI00247C8913|nr:hypothetical protein [Melioribacter sp.]
MNEENLSKLFSFETNINSDGSIGLPTEEFKKLFNQGFREIKIDIYGAASQALQNSNLDINLFNQIKLKQQLPDIVVLNFLKSKGSLINSAIKKRIYTK